MGKYQAYPEYVDSNYEVVDKFPSHWKATQAKYAYEVVLGKMLQNEKKREGDELKPYLRAANLAWSGVDISSVKEMWFSPEERVFLRLKYNDLLVSEGGDVGRSAIWRDELEECYFQNAINRIRPKINNSCKFMYYWLQFLKDAGYIDVICGKSTISHFTAEKVQSSPILLPPPNEQFSIVNFLDRETAKIDQLVAKQERLIELLKEKRQAVIPHAVTKGLDPDSPMKDSGIEWFWKIPQHWDTVKLKHLVEIINGYAFNSSDFVDDGVPVVRIGELSSQGYVDLSAAKLLPESFLSEHSDYKVLKGDYVLAMTGGTIGKVCEYKYETPALLNQRVCIIREKNQIHGNYLWLLLNSSSYKEHINLFCVGGAQPNISDRALAEFSVPLPPQDEQIQISDSSLRTLKSISSLITKSDHVIGLLKEHRSALISAAVTGKIDVRNWTPESPTEEAQEAATA